MHTNDIIEKNTQQSKDYPRKYYYSMFSLLSLFSYALVESNNFTGFWSWAHSNNRHYLSAAEVEYRQAVWSANVRMIEAHNSAPHDWTMAVNKFADMTADEFSALYITGGFNGNAERRVLDAGNHLFYSVGLPQSVDWSTQGAVTPVKNQGQCGSCWAFSTTGSLEGAHFLKNGTLASLSEQQLVDCAASTGNQGCNGGLMDDAFQYIINNGGITSEANYPYTAEDGICNTVKEGQIVATLRAFTDVPPNSDNALMAAVAQQPVSVAVEADQNSFQFYSSGVMTATCGTNLDHGVLAVGYGTDAGQDYYKVKNSWGADWGEAGYIRLGRGANYNGGAGQCGILSAASYPSV